MEFLQHKKFSRRIPNDISGGFSCGISDENSGGVSGEFHWNVLKESMENFPKTIFRKILEKKEPDWKLNHPSSESRFKASIIRLTEVNPVLYSEHNE